VKELADLDGGPIATIAGLLERVHMEKAVLGALVHADAGLADDCTGTVV